MTNAMRKSVLSKLRAEMMGSPALCQRIIQLVNQYFAEKWDPDYTVPKVRKLNLVLTRSSGSLNMKAQVNVHFDSARVNYGGAARSPFSWDRYETAEDLEQQIRELLPQLTDSVCSNLVARLPKSMEEGLLSRMHQTTDGPALHQAADGLSQHPHFRAMLQEKCTALQANYRKRMAKAPCPPGFQPSYIADLKVQCGVYCNGGETELQILMNNGRYHPRWEFFDTSYFVFCKNPEKLRDALYPRVLENVEALLQKEMIVPLLYTAPSLQALPGMTQPLETLLRRGSVSLGCVAVQWDGARYPGGLLLYQPGRSGGKVRYGKKEYVIEECPSVPLQPELLEQPQVPLLEIAALPQDLAGLCRLGAALQEALEQAFQGAEIPPPPVLLQADKKFRLTIRWSDTRIQLEAYQNSLGANLQKLVERIRQVAPVRSRERLRQLEVLCSLNPTELTVLRYVARRGKISLNALASAIEDRVSTTKAYTGVCLDRLTETKVPVDGEETPLLCFRVMRNQYRREYRRYSACAAINRNVLDAAVARPFGPADAEHMKPEVREKWFTRYLLEADEGQRWTRFNEALDCMPRTFLVRFAQSEEGQAFLQGFSGLEAAFVRLTLEALPGCKRLAARLWPDAAPGESGEA